MKTVLEMRHFCKNYGDFGLQNINMTLEKGTLTSEKAACRNGSHTL